MGRPLRWIDVYIVVELEQLGFEVGTYFWQAQDSWFSKKCKLVNLTNSSVFTFLTPSFLKKDEGRKINVMFVDIVVLALIVYV